METCLHCVDGTADGTARTALVGLGNPFYGDDAAGLVVARCVHQSLKCRESVDLLEPANSGFALAESLIGYQRAVIIDAFVDPRAETGTVRRLDAPDCYTGPPLTPHISGFHDGIALGRAAGLQVPSAITVYGIAIREPTSFRQGLSRELESRLPVIVAAIAEVESAVDPGGPFSRG